MIRKILLIEDSKEIHNVLTGLLCQYFQMFNAYTGKEGLRMAMELNPDLVILDLKLPDMDGFNVCKKIKENNITKTIPVIMLSGVYKTPEEKVRGFALGADDYIEKPFNEDELLARIKRIIYKIHGDIKSYIKINGVELFYEEREVLINKKKIKLTKTEFDLLYLLMNRKDCVLKRGFILYWFSCEKEGPDTCSLNSHIKNLRKKMGKKGDMIKTCIGVGYKFSND